MDPRLFEVLQSQVAGVAEGLKSLGGEILSTVAGVKGLAAVADATVGGVGSLVKILTGDLLGGLLSFGANLVQATKGLLELGLAATPGGIQVFGEVIQYLTTVLGAAFAPVVILLIAGVLTLADVFRGPLLSASKAVAMWLGERLAPGIAAVTTDLANFGEYVHVVGTLLKESLGFAVGALSHAIGFLLDKIPGTGTAGRELMDAGALVMREAIPNAMKEIVGALGRVARNDRQLAEGKLPIQRGGNGLFNKFVDNIETVLNGMSAAMGKQANVGFSAIGDIGKTIQMQSFQDDISARTLGVLTQILENGRDMLREFRRRQLPEFIL